ncbi:MAG: hypothetical protein QMC70_06265, partial [Bacteroidia bacterium]
IMETLNNVPDGSVVTIDGTKSISIHPDVREMISDFETHAAFSNIQLTLKGLNEGKQPNPVKEFKKTI